MLGLVVLTAERGCGLPPRDLLQPLADVPLLARAAAAAIPTDEAITGVLVVPDSMVDEVRSGVVERFGLDEFQRVVAGGPDRRSALAAGLAALPADVDLVVVQEGARALVPSGLVERVVVAARASGAAVAAVAPRDPMVEDDGGVLRLVAAPDRARSLQGPACFRTDLLRAALGEPGDATEAERVANGGVPIALVDGDPDNLLVRDDGDVTRALEAFARRAADFALIYPRDLADNAPLARALDAPRPV